MGWWSSIVGAVTSRIGGDRPEAPPPGQFTSVDADLAVRAKLQDGQPHGDAGLH